MGTDGRFNMWTTLKIFAALAFLQVSLAGGGAKCAKGDNQDDCAALNDLYHHTNGTNWCNNDGWLTDSSICTWQGVTCDTNGRVSRLELGQSGHTCTGPPFGHQSGNGLIGAIPNDIGHHLSSLTYLDLSANVLTGPIPESIGNLTGLTTLWLTGCGLTSIPESIGNLKALTKLYLTGNRFKWDQIPSSMGNLEKLEELTLASNHFPGTLPSFFGGLKALTFLDLDYSQLYGTLPTILPFPVSLKNLWLYGNQFTGTIPESIGQLTALEHLDLSVNKFTGPVPDGIGKLKALGELYLMRNQLSGKFNEAICSLYNNTRNPNGQLGVCYMNNNNFTCPLPTCAETDCHLQSCA